MAKGAHARYLVASRPRLVAQHKFGVGRIINPTRQTPLSQLQREVAHPASNGPYQGTASNGLYQGMVTNELYQGTASAVPQ
jgi:hypothetical protein